MTSLHFLLLLFTKHSAHLACQAVSASRSHGTVWVYIFVGWRPEVEHFNTFYYFLCYCHWPSGQQILK